MKYSCAISGPSKVPWLDEISLSKNYGIQRVFISRNIEEKSSTRNYLSRHVEKKKPRANGKWVPTYIQKKKVQDTGLLNRSVTARLPINVLVHTLAALEISSSFITLSVSRNIFIAEFVCCLCGI